MNKPLINLIKQKLPDRESYTRTPWRFWPSEASCVKPDGSVVGKCLRSSYYRWKEVLESNPVPDRVKLLGNIGLFVEYQTRKSLLANKIYPRELNKKENRKFRVNLIDDIILSGEVDIIAGNGQEICGIEVKSYSNSTHQLKDMPKMPHLLQTFLYAIYYNKAELPYFLIKYMPSMISKYATRTVYHRIDWVAIDNDIYPVINGGVFKSVSKNGIIKRYKESKYYIKNNILPKREFTKSTTNCKYCNYKDYCWKDKEGTNIE